MILFLKNGDSPQLTKEGFNLSQPVIMYEEDQRDY